MAPPLLAAYTRTSSTVPFPGSVTLVTACSVWSICCLAISMDCFVAHSHTASFTCEESTRIGQHLPIPFYII